MSNKKQVELTDITAPLLAATQGFTMEDREIGFLLDCAKRGETRSKQRSPSICEVPRILRDLSQSSFIPQLVSIGPIHREDPKLKEFERKKECYLDDLLYRFDSTSKKTILEACLLKVNTLIPEIRECYAGVKKNYSDVELARMMVMDVCFILEFCFKHEDEDLYLPNKMQNLRIAMDLMLLENQVPFFVLQALFDCSMGKVSFTLSNVLDKYLAPYMKLFDMLPENISIIDVDSHSTPAHVLGYLHRRYQPEVAKSSNREERIVHTAFHSIVDLDRSGVKFKPHQEDIWSMAIKFRLSFLSCLSWFWVCCCCCCCWCCCLFPCLSWFQSKATLLMPILLIDNFTELILRNFIAYEQSFPQDHRYYFTSYAHAMDRLIDSQEDIAKLVESRVLVNYLGSNQEAADMINKICKNIHITDFYYREDFNKMDKYYSGCWRNHFAQLRRVYFSNPWSIIALIAAIIMLLATVVSGIFAVLQYTLAD